MDENAYRAFAALIYATDIEEESVMRLYGWKAKNFSGDRQAYYETTIERNGKTVLLAAAKQPELGMTAAGILSMKLVEHYRPQFLIMPGIAAGVDTTKCKDQMYGDVLLATSVWNYSNGKYVNPHNADVLFGDIGFIPRPTLVEMDPSLVDILQLAASEKDHECYVDTGAMASGNAVVANSGALAPIFSQSFGTIGLDMEAYGVAYAAKEATEPRPYAIIAKSISDFADESKGDAYQYLASYTSCEFVRHLIEKVLPDRSLPVEPDEPNFPQEALEWL